MQPLRLAFMGTPDFAVPSLSELIAAEHEIVAVYTQAPKPAGRGQAPRKSPVHQFAERLGLPVRTPGSLNKKDVQEAFAALDLDAGIVAAYGLILPTPILDAPRLGCLNVHASLLPRWRGAAPIQRAIMAGDRQTGVTIMQMDAGLDTGAMLLSETVPIGPDTTAGALHDQLAKVGAALLPRALSALDRGVLVPQPQPAEGVTYADKIDKAEARIDWTRPAPDLDCHIRGLSPFPGAWCLAGSGDAAVRLKILRARPVEGDGAPGTILDSALTVACGTGALQLTHLQREGKRPMQADEFLRGLTLRPGDRLD